MIQLIGFLLKCFKHMYTNTELYWEYEIERSKFHTFAAKRAPKQKKKNIYIGTISLFDKF